MACLVSIIIPAYNSEKYIKRCISGVLKCTDLDFEIVVVDDGSSDNTYSVVEAMAENDLRIKLFTQTNQGVSKTRNAGLSYAQGKYVIFSDSDDMLDGENLKLLVGYAEDNDADLVAFGRINCYDNGSKIEYLPKGDLLRVEDDYGLAFGKTILNQQNFGWSSCNKLFKKDIIQTNDLKFLDYKTINSEDRLFNLSYFMHASKVAFFDKCRFYNFVRDDSLSHAKSFPNSVKRNVKAFEYVCEYTEKLPETVRFKLLRHYFISFLNNIAVLELSVNKAGVRSTSKSLKDTIKGMYGILDTQKVTDLFKREKDIYYCDNGFKYKMLNSLILKHRLYNLASTLLLFYVKITDVLANVKSKRKG